MRALIQRVRSASVSLDEKVHGSIGQGLVVFLGISPHDGEEQIQWMIRKLLTLRLFPAEEATSQSSDFDRDIKAVGGEILVVSQFTLYGETRKGRRPDFSKAAPPKLAEKIYDQFVHQLRSEFTRLATGVFGAHMQVDLQNDGPVTLGLESP